MDGIVTAIEPQERRGGRRVNVFVDGRYAFSLQRDLASLVRVGQPISELRSAELLLEDERARALDAAVAFLAYRPRSEREVRQRLAGKGVPEPILETVVERLKELRLIDDEDFARFWVEQRQGRRPRGPRLIRQELLRKGISADTSAEILADSELVEDPVEAACRAGRRKAESLQSLDERSFTQKLCQFLVRRGFDYETVRTATRRLWSSLESAQQD